MSTKLLPLLILIGISGINLPELHAHELGILKVYLEELDSGRYILKTDSKGLSPVNFPKPVPPPGCTCEIPESDEPLATMVTFEINCPGTGLRPGQVITLPWLRGGALVFAKWKNGLEANYFFPRQNEGIPIQMELLKAGGGSSWDVSWRFIRLGIEHILMGIDHLLFVMGLLLLVSGSWMLVKTITSFTIAHSITLGFATFGYVNAPSNLVDALVAMSIVFVGVEIVNKNYGRENLSTRAPWLIAFAFGLLHGFGFAGALNALGLPNSEIPLALFTFNAGVEIGQLIFVGIFLSVVWAMRQLEIPWPRWSRPVPAYIIGSLAAFWFIQRMQLLVQMW